MDQIIRANDTEALIELIKGGADIDRKHSIDHPPLTYCIFQNSVDCVKILLEAKADVNGNNFSPTVFYACMFGRDGILKLLIEHKADLHTKKSRERYHLHLAVQSNNLECAKLLINAGASENIDIKEEGKYSPLYYACERNIESIISLLLDNGAKIKELYDPKIHHSLFDKRKNIKRALIVFYHLGRKNECLGKDVTNMIGKMVWETRDQDEWLMNQNETKKYKN